MTNDSAAVQCGQCHFAVADKSRWGGRKFETIADLHANEIIGTKDDREINAPCPGGIVDSQHKACAGGGACHRHEQQVVQACPGKSCKLCHD
jgi:hypothetical protein